MYNLLPFNFILMKNLSIKNTKSTLLNIGYKFGYPLSIKNNPIIFNVPPCKKDNDITFYTQVLFGDLIPSYILLLCLKSTKHTTQSLVVNSTIIKNLSPNTSDILKEPLFMYKNDNLLRPIIHNSSIFLPRSQQNMRFLSNKAEQSYDSLIKQCHTNKITLKLNAGDLLIIDNKSILHSTDIIHDPKKLLQCLFIK